MVEDEEGKSPPSCKDGGAQHDDRGERHLGGEDKAENGSGMSDGVTSASAVGSAAGKSSKSLHGGETSVAVEMPSLEAPVSNEDNLNDGKEALGVVDEGNHNVADGEATTGGVASGQVGSGDDVGVLPAAAEEDTSMANPSTKRSPLTRFGALSQSFRKARRNLIIHRRSSSQSEEEIQSSKDPHESLYNKLAAKPVQKVNNRHLVSFNDIFQYQLESEYLLKNLFNRKSCVLKTFGYLIDENVPFTRFEDVKQEGENFLSSHLGQLSSPIDDKGEYYLTGVRSYVRVAKCSICRGGLLCGKDHHLQALLNDIEKNKKFRKKPVTLEDLDLTRDFPLVALFTDTSDLQMPPTQKNVSKSPNLFLVPKKDEWARSLHAEHVQKNDEFFHAHNDYFFPMGEIKGDASKGFIFDLRESTDIDSVINVCCLSLGPMSDPLELLSVLCQSREPKSIVRSGKEVQSLAHAGYALYCMFLHLRATRVVALDPLFTNKEFVLRDSFLGPTKENVVPLGFVFLLARLSLEKLILSHIPEFTDFATKHLGDKIGQDDDGFLYLTSKPDQGFAGVVASEYFPSLTSELSSVLGNYYTLIAKTLFEENVFLQEKLVSEELLSELYRYAEIAERADLIVKTGVAQVKNVRPRVQNSSWQRSTVKQPSLYKRQKLVEKFGYRNDKTQSKQPEHSQVVQREHTHSNNHKKQHEHSQSSPSRHKHTHANNQTNREHAHSHNHSKREHTYDKQTKQQPTPNNGNSTQKHKESDATDK